MLGGVIIFEIFLAGLVLLNGSAYLHARQVQAAYQSAPSCEAVAAGTECRDQRSGTVVDGGYTTSRAGRSYWVAIDVPGLGSQRALVSQSLVGGLYPGENVEIEIWRGSITLINGLQTKDNPNAVVYQAQGLALFCAMLMLLGVIPGWLALVGLRRSSQRSIPTSAAA